MRISQWSLNPEGSSITIKRKMMPGRQERKQRQANPLLIYPSFPSTLFSNWIAMAKRISSCGARYGTRKEGRLRAMKCYQRRMIIAIQMLVRRATTKTVVMLGSKEIIREAVVLKQQIVVRRKVKRKQKERENR